LSSLYRGANRECNRKGKPRGKQGPARRGCKAAAGKKPLARRRRAPEMVLFEALVIVGCALSIAALYVVVRA
jgi:hypothetical protein